jgi:L-gulonolactone oxidase
MAHPAQTFVQQYKMHITVVIILVSIALYFFRKFLKKIHQPTIEQVNGKWRLTNFGMTQTWEPSDIFKPTSKSELIDFLKTQRAAKGIKHLRAFGGLHSWSRCAATTGVNIDVTGLNKVLHVDKAKRLITAEAGIILKDLYKAMRENEMAFPSMPNIDIITLGGAVSNGTHGTSIENGSFSSLVYAIELIDAKGNIHTLTKDSKDPKLSRYFDAALISFGSLGVIYSITMQGVEDFNMFNVRSNTDFVRVKGNIAKIAKSYNSIQFLFQEDRCYLRSSTRVGTEGTYKLAAQKRKFLFHIELMKDLFWFLHSLGVASKFCQKLYRAIYYELNLVTWDQYEIFHHTKPFTNMEYAVPESKVEQAVEFIMDTFKKAKIERNLFWVIRPVGADERGFLSSTRRDDMTPTYYIDIPYQNKSEDEKELFKQIENGLLALGGRCSFARLFWNHTPAILENFWDKGGKEWKKVKLELDPEHVFTNELVDNIFFEGKVFGKK